MNNIAEPINIELELPMSDAGQRLDQALAHAINQYSRAQIQTWIKNAHVTVDGKIRPAKYKINGGEKVVIHATLAAKVNSTAQAIALDIIFEDDDIVVLNKPAGLVVHPAAGNPDNTLLNALLHHAPNLELLPRAGIIHRLDKDTSGIMVVAKNLTAHHHLVDSLQRREIKREYETIVQGVMTAGGTVETHIGRHPRQRMRMAVVKNGKEAITHYRIIKKFPAYTHVRVMLETGRTHQIRVHMAHIHYPIVGDPVYNGRLQLPKGASPELIAALQSFKRQALHAKELQLTHPRTHELMSWQAPLPDDMQELLNILNQI